MAEFRRLSGNNPQPFEWNSALEESKPVYIADVFNAEDINKLGQEYGWPTWMFTDSLHFNQDLLTGRCVYLPVWLRNNTEHLLEHCNEFEKKTHACFNFAVNRKDINRHLLIKLVEAYGFNSYWYTWSGVDANYDLSITAQELETATVPEWITKQLFAPIGIDPHHYNFAEQDNISHTDRLPVVNNAHSWNNGIGSMMSSTAVALISEPENNVPNRSIHFSEKTIYSILAHNFPIWIGGYGQADEFARMGFDTFADVINHDYQYAKTHIERCYQAIDLNKHLLTFPDTASQKRKECELRFADNVSLLKNNQIQEYILEKINDLPAWADKGVLAQMIDSVETFKNEIG